MVRVDDLSPHRLYVDRLLDFDAAYFERRAARSAQRFRQHNPFLLGFWSLGRVGQRDRSLAIRFAIVPFFFPLTYYFSHPETHYLSRRSAHRGSRGGGRAGAPEAEC